MTAASRGGIVIDSTAQLTPEHAARLEQALDGAFRIVDLTVDVDEESRPDRAWSAGHICAAMRQGAQVRTSLPPVLAFTEAIQAVRAAGAESIIVLTLSGELSGTCDAARTAAQEFSPDVHVIDSRTTSAGLAGAVEVACAGLSAGLPPAQIVSAVEDWCAAESTTFFIPEDLEYLRRGGRIGRAASLLGRALAITPVLALRGGVVEPLARVRTQQKARERLVRLVEEFCAELRAHDPDAGIEVVVQHPEQSAEQAGPGLVQLCALLDRADLAGALHVRTTILSTVITAHVGPGALGVTVQTLP